jgi:hypothetical protein
VNDRTRPELVLLLALLALGAGVVAALVAIALATNAI